MPAIVAPAIAAAATTTAGTTAAATAAAAAAKAAAVKAAAAEAAKTATLEASKKGIIEGSMKQAAQQATQQATQQAAQQGIAQAGTQATQQAGVEALKQGVATPMPPAGGTPFTPPTTGATPMPPAGSNVPTPITQVGQPLDPSQSLAFKANAPVAQGPVPEFMSPQTALPKGAPYNDPGTLARTASDQGIAQMNTTPTSELMLKPTYQQQFPLSEPSALQKGFETGLQYVKDKPLETGLLTMGIGQYMNKPEEEDKDKYKNTVDMSGFQPSVPTQRPFTPSYEYQSYAMGGPVEQMAAQNAVGQNTGYPMANLQTPMYSNPAMQRPEATNLIAPSADAGIASYSGESRFAEGGLSSAERREYGLRTRGQRAAQSLTKSYEEMEEERQKEAMRLMGERSDPGIVPRSRTQQMSSPFSAAVAEHARLGKKAKVPVVQMPKTNLGDIDNYMDIPIEAAKGGIIRGKEMKFSNGGPAFMGPTGSGYYGAGSYSEGARLPGNTTPRPTSGSPATSVLLPEYKAAVQQKTYTPISYQNNSSYQMPAQQSNVGNSAQQSDMSDFYNYMDQELANYGNYGYAAGGGIMSNSNLGGYSDGGRLLRGPGDGVSDSIPAVIGKRQPARLADGEFVIPARIVSELGNGSTEAGARKLYAMMERVQASRKKSIGKKKVAVNSKSDKHLPA